MTKPQIEHADSIIGATWLLPIRPQKTVLRNHALVIKNQKIIAIKDYHQACQQYQADHQAFYEQQLLMPGLVNGHGHAAMSLFRGMADDQPLMRWLEDHIWPAESRWVSEQFVYEGTELAIAEMLRSGTTCFSDMYFFPEAAAKVADKSGIRAQLAFPIIDFPSNWAKEPAEYISKGLALMDSYKNLERITIAFGPHAPYTVSDEVFSKITTLAAELDAPIQIHLHETQGEVDESIKKYGKRPIERMNELGLLGPKTQLVHMTALNEEDIALVKNTASSVVSCPLSNLKLASGFCPSKQLIDQEINLALGTDGAASNNDLDMFVEMRNLALLAKAVSGDAQAVNAWQALEIATLGGAKALGLDESIGSLEISKAADFISIDFSQLEQQPLYNIASQLVYGNCGNLVQNAWVNGKQILQQRQTVNMNLNALIDNAKTWQEKISQ